MAKACDYCGSKHGRRVTLLVCPDCRDEILDPRSDADHDALEVLCRVFDDGVDAAYPEWLAWYKPAEWLGPARALGAFIHQRLARGAARALRTQLHPDPAPIGTSPPPSDVGYTSEPTA